MSQGQFRDNLKIALNDSGMIQIELARKSKIPQSLLSEYMSGRRSPRANYLKKLADILNITMDELWGD